MFELTESLGLSSEALKAALEKGTFVPKIRSDFLGGVHSGVNGTPTFFINNQRHNGPFEFENMVPALESVLSVKND